MRCLDYFGQEMFDYVISG